MNLPDEVLQLRARLKEKERSVRSEQKLLGAAGEMWTCPHMPYIDSGGYRFKNGEHCGVSYPVSHETAIQKHLVDHHPEVVDEIRRRALRKLAGGEDEAERQYRKARAFGRLYGGGGGGK